MNSLKESVATPEVSSQEARQIAKEAFIYGFPMVANYQTMHKQAIDTAGHDFRATFNTIASLANVATPATSSLSRQTPTRRTRSFGWT